MSSSNPYAASTSIPLKRRSALTDRRSWIEQTSICHYCTKVQMKIPCLLQPVIIFLLQDALTVAPLLRVHSMGAPHLPVALPWDCSGVTIPLEDCGAQTTFLPSGMSIMRVSQLIFVITSCMASLGGRCVLLWRDGLGTQRSLLCPC
jgi:hypothetical protein